MDLAQAIQISTKAYHSSLATASLPRAGLLCPAFVWYLSLVIAPAAFVPCCITITAGLSSLSHWPYTTVILFHCISLLLFVSYSIELSAYLGGKSGVIPLTREAVIASFDITAVFAGYQP